MTRATILISTVLLAACAADATRPAPDARAPARNVIAQIRDEAAKYRADFQVELIREAAIAEAIEASKQAEMRGDRKAAETALESALSDPEAKQRYAELLLARGQAAQAEKLAREAYDASARTGEWCARSWLTVAHAREMQNAPNGAQQARGKVAECKSPEVNRY